MSPAQHSGRDGERGQQSPVERASSAARELAETVAGKASEERASEIEERWETWLAWPVLIAAIVSVPAVFLTLLDEPFERVC